MIGLGILGGIPERRIEMTCRIAEYRFSPVARAPAFVTVTNAVPPKNGRRRQSRRGGIRLCVKNPPQAPGWEPIRRKWYRGGSGGAPSTREGNKEDSGRPAVTV
jgi:hypothetical protein